MMIVFKHFLRKKITKMKSYRNLALVNFLNYVKMKKLFSLMNSNQLFFHRIIFFSFVKFGLWNEESFGFQTCRREGVTRYASHCNVNEKMIFGCQERPLKVSFKLYEQGSRNKILN